MLSVKRVVQNIGHLNSRTLAAIMIFTAVLLSAVGGVTTEYQFFVVSLIGVILVSAIVPTRFLLYIFVILVVAFPQGWGMGSLYYLFGTPIEIFDVVFLIVVLAWLRDFLLRRFYIQISVLSLVIFAFLAYVGFSFVRGLEGGTSWTLLDDTRKLSLYFLTIVVYSQVVTEQDFGSILKTLVAGNLVYSLIPLSVLLLGERSRFWQYVPHIYVSQERAGFSNVDVQVFVLLILIQFLVFSGRRLRVRTFIIAICGLVLITIDILYSQFRSIWLVSVLGVVVLWNSQLLVNRKYRKRGSLQRIPRTIIFGVIIFVSFVVTIGVFEVVGRYNLSTIGERLATLQNVQATMSYRNRLADSQLVLEEAAKRNLLLGSGLGVTWNYLSTYGIIGFVDNTFATMFAKIGLIGLAFFLMLFFVFFREIYLLMKSRWFFDDDLKSIVAIEISVLTTLFLLPFFSAHLFNQRPVITCFAVFLGGVSALRRHVSEIT